MFAFNETYEFALLLLLFLNLILKINLFYSEFIVSDYYKDAVL